jgi:hypothetical protein
MAALSIAGVRANVGKGLKVADAIKIQPPAVAGGPVCTPGSIASTGPVDIGPSLMAATGVGAGKARPDESSSTERLDAEGAAKESSRARRNEHLAGERNKGRAGYQ